MSKSYDEIMAALLEAYEAHPEMDVEQIIAQVSAEIGASDNCQKTIKETSALLDKFQEKKASLAAAHANGDSTKKWILMEVNGMADGKSEEEKSILLEGISKAVNKGVESIETEE